MTRPSSEKFFDAALMCSRNSLGSTLRPPKARRAIAYHPIDYLRQHGWQDLFDGSRRTAVIQRLLAFRVASYR